MWDNPGIEGFLITIIDSYFSYSLNRCSIQFQPVGNPWWNMSIQQLQPAFTQSQFIDETQAEDQNTQPVDTSMDITDVSMMSTTEAPEPVPKMDICTDDSFIGGSCLKLEADVELNKFVKYRYGS